MSVLPLPSHPKMAQGGLKLLHCAAQGLQEDTARAFFQQLMIALEFCHELGIANRCAVLQTAPNLPSVTWSQSLSLHALAHPRFTACLHSTWSAGCSCFCGSVSSMAQHLWRHDSPQAADKEAGSQAATKSWKKPICLKYIMQYDS